MVNSNNKQSIQNFTVLKTNSPKTYSSDCNSLSGNIHQQILKGRKSQKHKTKPVPSLDFKCSKCDATFSSISDLAGHFSTSHEKTAEVSTSTNKTFNSIVTLVTPENKVSLALESEVTISEEHIKEILPHLNSNNQNIERHEVPKPPASETPLPLKNNEILSHLNSEDTKPTATEVQEDLEIEEILPHFNFEDSESKKYEMVTPAHTNETPVSFKVVEILPDLDSETNDNEKETPISDKINQKAPVSETPEAFKIIGKSIF